MEYAEEVDFDEVHQMSTVTTVMVDAPMFPDMNGGPMWTDNFPHHSHASVPGPEDHINHIEPCNVRAGAEQECVKLKEVLLDVLQGREVITIDNIGYKNEEIDGIIEKIESFAPKFNALQNELDVLHAAFATESKKTEANVQKIESSIQFIKAMAAHSEKDAINDICSSLGDLCKSISDNDKLSEVKDKYIGKRKELNSYLYFIQKLNKWNSSAICPICITDSIDSYCVPCGHTACKKCLERSASHNESMSSQKCPICREFIDRINKLYFI